MTRALRRTRPAPMEKPSNSSTATTEESSWASYIADFVATQQAEESMRASKKLSTKRRKTAAEDDDDPLEDTATSPVKTRRVRTIPMFAAFFLLRLNWRLKLFACW